MIYVIICVNWPSNQNLVGIWMRYTNNIFFVTSFDEKHRGNDYCYGLDVFQRGFGECFVIAISVLYLKPICEALFSQVRTRFSFLTEVRAQGSRRYSYIFRWLNNGCTYLNICLCILPLGPWTDQEVDRLSVNGLPGDRGGNCVWT